MRGGWHQRKRRQPGRGLEGGHHRLQHPCRCPAPQAGRAERRGHPLLQHHLRCGGRGEGRDVGHAAPEKREQALGWWKSARCSWSARSARWPAATWLGRPWSSAGSSSARAAQQRGGVDRRAGFAQALQGRREGSEVEASSAVCRSRTSTISSKAISSKCSRSRKSLGRCKAGVNADGRGRRGPVPPIFMATAICVVARSMNGMTEIP